MRAWLSFLVGGGVAAVITYSCLVETKYVRRGWFELDGQPVRLDGRAVADWQEVNDLLARPAADLEKKLGAIHDQERAARNGQQPAGKIPDEFLDRIFELEYRPSVPGTVLRRVVVQRFLSTNLAGGGHWHPAAYARHEIVESTDPGVR